jgi:hypothetical protein
MNKQIAGICKPSLFMGVLLLFVACTRYQPKPHYGLTDSFRNYVVFKPGSYWVYKDPVTQATDTMRMLESRIEKKQFEEKYSYDYLVQKKHSSLTGDTLLGYSSLEGDNGRFFFVYFEKNLSQYFNDRFLGTMLRIDNKLTYENYLEKMVIKSTEYSAVKVFKSEVEAFDGNVSRVYYGRNVGMVQYEPSKNVRWELISSKIIQ